MESSETGGGNLVLKARTSRTAGREASDNVGLIVGFIIVARELESRVVVSSCFQNLSDTRRSGGVFERSM